MTSANSAIVIVGCSGLGREVAWICKRNGLNVEGFLDDDKSLHGKTFEGAQVIGGIDKTGGYKSFPFFVAVASPKVRMKIVAQLKKLGVENFATIIDKDAIIGDSSTLGEGSILFPGSIVTVNCKLGAHNVINKNCSIGHDCNLGDFCTLAPLAMLGGYVSLGQGVDVGASACIRQAIQVGNYARIGMGSVVVKNVPEEVTVVGNPGRVLGAE